MMAWLRGAGGVRRSRFKVRLTDDQRLKEGSIKRAIWLDCLSLSLLAIAAVVSSSLTLMAEFIRGALLLSIEGVSLVTLRRQHRGQLFAFEYGIGKIERTISVVIGFGLYFAAFYTLSASLERLDNPEFLPTPAMMFGLAIAAVNLAQNAFCCGDFARANQAEASLILDSQFRSRLVKTVASLVVVLVLLVATWLPDPTGAAYVDVLGAVFVVVYMAWTGTTLLSESLPELWDRALPEHEQMLLMRVLSSHFERFQRFGSVKSRRASGRAFIDIELEFEGDQTLQQVHDRCAAIRRDIVAVIPDAVVTVVPHAPGEGDEAAATAG